MIEERALGYDQIAAIYDADMGASMRFPDVAFYLAQAQNMAGPVLEIGCGTGRILAPMRAAGVDVSGVDQSAAMLKLAAQRCPDASLWQQDMRALALPRRFRLILMPYSVCTYLTSMHDWQRLGENLRAVCLPDAQLLIDAFVPQPGLHSQGWIYDYSRRHQGQWLVRYKRIQALADGSHQIERRYRLRGAFAGRTLHTREHIRPYAPSALEALCQRHLGDCIRTYWDYDERNPAASARFCTLLVALRSSQ